MSAPEQLYYGGEIYTVDEKQPTAEALAVKDGIIAAVGTLAECRAALGRDFEAIDLAGRAMLPGFIDTHLHPTLMVFYDLNLNLSGVRSTGELQEKLKRRAGEEQGDDWIVGLQLDDRALREGVPPARGALDEACPGRPVIIVTYDGHRVLANSRAIEAAGITADTPDPAGGRIEREPDGRPAGIFHESAAQLLLSRVPLPGLEKLFAGAEATFAGLAARGITSAGVVLQTDGEGPAGDSGAYDLPFLQMALKQIPVNLYCLLIARDLAAVTAARQSGLHRTESGAARRIGAVKLFCDGTLQAGTAFMSSPYADHPGNSGFMVLDEAELYRRMAAAHAEGLQLAVHAIGDAAVRVCVKLYSRLLKKFPKEDHRHRLEHASVLNPALIRDIARLGLVVSSQPLFIHAEKHWLAARLGPERVRWTYPYRALVEAGVKVAGASDAPICSPDVLHALQCCVTREGFEPRQSLSAAQAVRLFTLDAAYAQFEEREKGSLSAGKRADLVILSANPVTVPPGRIRSIRVLRTVCGGRTIFQS